MGAGLHNGDTPLYMGIHICNMARTNYNTTTTIRYRTTEYYDAFNPALGIEVHESGDRWRVTGTKYNGAGVEEDHIDEYAADELEALDMAKRFLSKHGFDDADLR